MIFLNWLNALRYSLPVEIKLCFLLINKIINMIIVFKFDTTKLRKNIFYNVPCDFLFRVIWHKNMATPITKISTFILIICVLFVNGDPGGDAVNPPSFTVNLDLPEEKRWSNIVLKYKDLAPAFYYIVK